MTARGCQARCPYCGGKCVDDDPSHTGKRGLEHHLCDNDHEWYDKDK